MVKIGLKYYYKKCKFMYLNTEFSVELTPYNPEIVAKIKRGREDFLNGNCITINIEEIWN